MRINEEFIDNIDDVTIKDGNGSSIVKDFTDFPFYIFVSSYMSEKFPVNDSSSNNDAEHMAKII